MRLAFYAREELPAGATAAPVTIYHILPESLCRPVWLAVSGLFPWLLLLAANFYLLDPVWGEMSPEQLNRAKIWLGAGVLMAVLHAGVAGARALRRETTRLPELGVLVLLAVGYLWLSVAWLLGEKLVPASVSRWILPPENLLGIQFLLAVPPLFYGLLRLACFETRSRFIAGPVAAVVATTLGPALMFGGGMLMSLFGIATGRLLGSEALPHWAHQIFVYGYIVVFVALSVLTLAGVLRLGAGAFLWTRGLSPLWTVLLNGAFCLLMPLGGLCLNISIPFPVDFQNAVVYLLATINGLLLAWPAPADPRWRRVRWVAVAAFFPFSLYFFLIFLPWMPLALPAIMALGAGFLILAPIVLFGVHLQELMQGWQKALDDGGRVRSCLVVMAAMAILPGFLLGQTLADRLALRAALDYIQRAPYRENLPAIDAARAASTLHRMRDMQQGQYMPVLSEVYKEVVFDGMVLQQEKIRQFYRFFTGSDLPAVRPGVFRGMLSQDAVIRSTNRINPFANGRVIARPALSPAGSAEGWSRYTLDLGLLNDSSQPGEYVGRLRLPEGMWITGMELDIGGKMVPAKVFEKKTALWVYQKIRDTDYRRDPALVFYEDSGEVEVRVFPFTAQQTRPARLALLAAPGVAPRVRLDGMEVSCLLADPPAPASSRPVAVATSRGTVVVLPQDSCAAVERPRAVHFIVDRSVGGPDDNAVSAVMARVMADMGVAAARVTEANYRSVTHKNPLASGETPACRLDRAGGFGFERAVKTVLAGQASSSEEPAGPGTATLFVAVVKDPKNMLKEERGKGWLGLAEDAEVYGVATASGTEWRRWSDDQPSGRPVVRAAAVLRQGADVRTVLPGKTSRMLEFPGATSGPVQVFDGRGWIPVGAASGMDPKIVQGLEAWMAAVCMDLYPEQEAGLFPEAVRLAREAGILTPPTSLMVVENSAQWKMLERKEKQKTAAAKEFDFEEEPPVTPEPATWMLLALGLAALVGWKKFGKTRSLE